MTTKRPAQEVEKLGPVGNTAQAQKWACTRTRTIARFHLLIFFFFLDVQKSCKNHTLTLKCLIPHLNRLVFIWRQWTDHLWTYKTMDHKSGTKSDNKMQKTQIEKDDDAEKNTDNVQPQNLSTENMWGVGIKPWWPFEDVPNTCFCVLKSILHSFPYQIPAHSNIHYGAAQHQDRHHAAGYTHNNKIKNQPVNTSSNSCVAVTFLSLPVLRSVSIGLRGKTVYWNWWG